MSISSASFVHPPLPVGLDSCEGGEIIRLLVVVWEFVMKDSFVILYTLAEGSDMSSESSVRVLCKMDEQELFNIATRQMCLINMMY